MPRWLYIAALAGVVVHAVGATGATLSGRTYEQVAEAWHFVDSHGEKWEIEPGLVEVRFEGNLTESQRDSLAVEFGLTHYGPEPHAFEEYFRFTYSLAVDPIDVLATIDSCTLVVDADLAWRIKPLGDPYSTFDKQWNSYLIEPRPRLLPTRFGTVPPLCFATLQAEEA